MCLPHRETAAQDGFARSRRKMVCGFAPAPERAPGFCCREQGATANKTAGKGTANAGTAVKRTSDKETADSGQRNNRQANGKQANSGQGGSSTWERQTRGASGRREPPIRTVADKGAAAPFLFCLPNGNQYQRNGAGKSAELRFGSAKFGIIRPLCKVINFLQKSFLFGEFVV